ncbi:MAG: hypothetical protein ACD_46C00311G0004 [uncultured bacterium]|nr:MAG: hypothetical protein ACD_46C00311G0004 [uncultured bacterium]
MPLRDKDFLRQDMDIRILSYNIHKGIGWTIRKSTLTQIHTQILEIHPELIFLQEIRGTQFELIAEKIWPHFSYGKNAVYEKGHHGNAILSKFPILFSENIDLTFGRYERRGLLHAIIQLTNHGQPLHLLCVHLGLFKSDRCKQIAKIVQHIQSNIPQNEPLILGGDFNDWSSFATEPLIHNLGLEEAFLSSCGGYAKTFPAWAPMLRLDRLYYRGFDTSHANCLANKPWRQLSDHIALDVALKPNFKY